MRRRFNPWVVVLTAALTFGSLMAFVGPHRFGPYGGYGFGHRWHGYGGYRACDGYWNDNSQGYGRDGFRRPNPGVGGPGAAAPWAEQRPTGPNSIDSL